MSYVIGSFNVMKLSVQPDKETNRDFGRLADIIKRENFDVVALQEVFTSEAISQKLLRELGEREWDFCWDRPQSLGTSAEGYAFLWKKSRLKLVEANDNPEIFNQYSIQDSRISGSDKRLIGGSGIVRPPYVARFTPSGLLGGSFFEIRLINTHISFGKPKDAEMYMADPEMKDLAVRRQELTTLSEEIYRRVSVKQYGDNMPSYTILLGDYNLCLCGNEDRMEFIKIDNARILRTVQKEKTSLKQVKKDEEQRPVAMADYYANDYDHFSYETALDDKLRLTVSRVDALEKYYGNDLEAYRHEISDHVPIKLALDLTLREGLRSHGM